jgi:hypothetical protein
VFTYKERWPPNRLPPLLVTTFSTLCPHRGLEASVPEHGFQNSLELAAILRSPDVTGLLLMLLCPTVRVVSPSDIPIERQSHHLSPRVRVSSVHRVTWSRKALDVPGSSHYPSGCWNSLSLLSLGCEYAEVRSEETILVSWESVQTTHCKGCFLAVMENVCFRKNQELGMGLHGKAFS